MKTFILNLSKAVSYKQKNIHSNLYSKAKKSVVNFYPKGFINSSISPNLEVVDIINAIKLLFFPFSIRSGNYISKVEFWFRYNFSRKFAYTFSSAREAEYALLKSIGTEKGDEVLMQSFTCLAVVNPILWLNAKPIYVDIDISNYSMDIEDLKAKINKNTRAIIVQHTFGIPSNIEEIKNIAKDKKIFMIEDCAHVINGKHKNKKLGKWGDAAFFSFGRDKAISSVFGGIVILNNKKIADKIKRIKDLSPYPSYAWIFQQLMHPISTFFVIKLFNFYPLMGKIGLFFLKKINLISIPIVPEENDPYMRNYRTRKYPNALATLAFFQLLRLNKFNKNRLEMYKIYEDKLGKLKNKLSFPSFKAFYLKIPIIVKDKEKLVEFCREYSIYLGDWYSNVIDPKGTDYNKIFYKKGSCKVAEKVACNVLNLPCHPTMTKKDAEKVVKVIKLYYEKERKYRS